MAPRPFIDVWDKLIRGAWESDVGKSLLDQNDILPILKSKAWDPCVPSTLMISALEEENLSADRDAKLEIKIYQTDSVF